MCFSDFKLYLVSKLSSLLVRMVLDVEFNYLVCESVVACAKQGDGPILMYNSMPLKEVETT